MNKAITPDNPPDYNLIKERQKGIWASGDYARVGTTLQIVGENLAEAMDIRADQKVLDVAAGNGNFSLAAARRWADVTSTDYVGSLLEHGHQRAIADGMELNFQIADVEALPFDDASFDAVASTFGVMFAPNQIQAATEMLRVVRKGGAIGLANWTPSGFVGQIFKIIGRYTPPPAGLQSPALWGTNQHIEMLFGRDVEEIEIKRKDFNFRYRSAAHWLEIFRNYYGPIHKTFAALEGPMQQSLAEDLHTLIDEMNQSDEVMLVPGEYLEIVMRR